jgi:hypothetical protein
MNSYPWLTTLTLLQIGLGLVVLVLEVLRGEMVIRTPAKEEDGADRP